MPQLPSATRSIHHLDADSAQHYHNTSASNRTVQSYPHKNGVHTLQSTHNHSSNAEQNFSSDPFADSSFLPEFDPDFEDQSSYSLQPTSASSYLSVSSSMKAHASPDFQHSRSSPHQQSNHHTSAIHQHQQSIGMRNDGANYPVSKHHPSYQQQQQQQHSLALSQHFRPSVRPETYDAIVDAACGDQLTGRSMRNQSHFNALSDDIAATFHVDNGSANYPISTHQPSLVRPPLPVDGTFQPQHPMPHHSALNHQQSQVLDHMLPKGVYARAPVSHSHRVSSHPYQTAVHAHQAAKQRNHISNQQDIRLLTHIPRPNTYPIVNQSVEQSSHSTAYPVNNINQYVNQAASAMRHTTRFASDLEHVHVSENHAKVSSHQPMPKHRMLERGVLPIVYQSLHKTSTGNVQRNSQQEAALIASFNQSHTAELTNRMTTTQQPHGSNQTYPSFAQSVPSHRASRQNPNFMHSADQNYPSLHSEQFGSDFVISNQTRQHFDVNNYQAPASHHQHIPYQQSNQNSNNSHVPQHGGPVPESQQRSANNVPATTQVIQPHELADQYVVLDYLGSGSYGSVHLAERKSDGRKVAIKKIVNIFENLTNAKRLLREIKILRMLNHQSIDPGRPNTQSSTHENVIGFYHLCPVNDLATFNDLCIVFEFVDTDLQKLIHSHQHFSNLHVQFFMYQLIVGVAYVHSASIIHRDIKPANVLVNADCSLKLCDFGLSRVNFSDRNQSSYGQASPHVNQQPQLAPTRNRRLSSISSLPSSLIQLPTPPSRARRELTKHVVTRWYRAPELILLSDHYTTAIDIWSIGCILAELLSMQQESSTSPEDRQALFPGRSCFPLSADHPHAYADQLDQLNVIFDVIGTPSREDLSKIDNETARTYLINLPDKSPIDLFARYPGADARAVNLLMRMLCFNPANRISALECLQHPYFDEVRDDSISLQWRTVNPSVNPHKEFAFEGADMNEDQIRALLIEELLIDQPHLAYPPRMSPISHSHQYPSSSSSRTYGTASVSGTQQLAHSSLHDQHVVANPYAANFRVQHPNSYSHYE